ncbi:MAG: hypothetical protein ACR2P0_05680, partial [Acidimicrobiales bacterium]
DVDDSTTFQSAGGSISIRPMTAAAAAWAPPPWTSKGEAGPAQQTSDLTTIVQELVDRAGWSSGNSMSLIISGTGKRTAESFNGTPTAAPLLHIEYVG